MRTAGPRVFGFTTLWGRGRAVSPVGARDPRCGACSPPCTGHTWRSSSCYLEKVLPTVRLGHIPQVSLDGGRRLLAFKHSCQSLVPQPWVFPVPARLRARRNEERSILLHSWQIMVEPVQNNYIRSRTITSLRNEGRERGEGEGMQSAAGATVGGQKWLPAQMEPRLGSAQCWP